jgi:hypothetical protein
MSLFSYYILLSDHLRQSIFFAFQIYLFLYRVLLCLSCTWQCDVEFVDFTFWVLPPGASHILDYCYHIQGMQSESNLQFTKLTDVFNLRSLGVVRISWDVGTIWSIQFIVFKYNSLGDDYCLHPMEMCEYQGCTPRRVFAKKYWVRPGRSKISSGRSLGVKVSWGYPGISPGGLFCQKI